MLKACRHPATVSAETLLVMLPGAMMTPQHFVDAGFPAALAQSFPAADLQLVELDINQLASAATVAALHRDIIQPARQGGYRRIVLGGISLGGAMAMHYAREHGAQISGLCLLAPYPGSRLSAGAIRAAGGLQAWQASAEQLRDPEFRLWHWLAQRPADPPIYLGYGRADRFADGLAMMADALPAARVHTVSGGHEWSAWRALWDDFLAVGMAAMRDRG